MEQKRQGRKPKLKTILLDAGYIYKPKVLTKEEKKIARNGIPVPGKPGIKTPPPDYLYYFKFVDGVEVRIYSVGPDYYYEGVKLKGAHQLPLIEKHAKENKVWKYLDNLVEDTAPPGPTNQIVATEHMPHVISLSGGPLDGQKRAWNSGFQFFMEQIEINGKVEAHRYRRDKENKLLYVHQDVF